MSPQRRADLAYVVAILIGVLFVILLGPLDRRLEILHLNDFSGLWAGPRAVLAGVSPWDPANYPAARIAFDTQRDDALVLNYMPWTVIALLPLGLLPLDLAAWIWMALSMICGAIALRALLRTFMPRRAVVHAMLGLALFAGQPGFHTIVLGQWALLLMSALVAIVLAVRAGHARRAGFAALALLAKPQLFVWTALGLAIPAFIDSRYRRFVAFAVVVAGALTRLHVVQEHGASLGLGHHLVSHDQDVAVAEVVRRRAGKQCGEVVPRTHLGQPRQCDELDAQLGQTWMARDARAPASAARAPERSSWARAPRVRCARTRASSTRFQTRARSSGVSTSGASEPTGSAR